MTDTATEGAERWVPARGFPGYEVSSLGRVRSWHKRPNERLWPTEPRPIVGGTDRDGYLRARLRCGELQYRSVKFHHLVLASFGVERPFPEAVTRHLDGDKTNNAIANLVWGTQQENIDDRRRLGRCARKLSQADYEAIRTQRGSASQAELARRYGVTRHTIWCVQDGRRVGLSGPAAGRVLR
jgi:hypothetical protein